MATPPANCAPGVGGIAYRPPPPPPPCVVPPQNRLRNISKTRPTYVNSLGGRWGVTAYEPDVNVVYEPLCASEWRISGTIGLHQESSIKIATQVGFKSPCANGGPREGPFVERTKVHEDVHADALVGVINQYRPNIYGDWKTKTACETAGRTFLQQFNTDWQQMLTKHATHNGTHPNEIRTGRYCPSPYDNSTPTIEIYCGSYHDHANQNCDSGNTY